MERAGTGAPVRAGILAGGKMTVVGTVITAASASTAPDATNDNDAAYQPEES
jgi:hypothetical protein